jgi:hypothetical protein
MTSGKAPWNPSDVRFESLALECVLVMSALSPIADFDRQRRKVRFVPKALLATSGPKERYRLPAGWQPATTGRTDAVDFAGF